MHFFLIRHLFLYATILDGYITVGSSIHYVTLRVIFRMVKTR